MSAITLMWTALVTVDDPQTIRSQRKPLSSKMYGRNAMVKWSSLTGTNYGGSQVLFINTYYVTFTHGNYLKPCSNVLFYVVVTH